MIYLRQISQFCHGIYLHETGQIGKVPHLMNQFPLRCASENQERKPGDTRIISDSIFYQKTPGNAGCEDCSAIFPSQMTSEADAGCWTCANVVTCSNSNATVIPAANQMHHYSTVKLVKTHFFNAMIRKLKGFRCST